MKLPWRREQVVSGLGTQENTAKLMALVLVPFYALYFGTYYLIEYGYVEETFGVMLFFVGLVVEISAMYGYNAKQQKEASEHLNFDASKWRFHPEEIACFDIFFKENDIVHLSQDKYFDHLLKILRNDKDIQNGEKVAQLLESYIKNRKWEAFLLKCKNPVEVMHGRNGNPSVFTKSILLTPVHWRQMWHFIPGGESWYGNFPITHPAHENLLVHNVDWLGYKGEDIPIGVVKDSFYHYQKTLTETRLNPAETKENNINLVDILLAKIAFLLEKNIGLEADLEVLNPHIHGLLSQSVELDKRVRERMADIKRRHGDIMREQPPLRYRLINLKTFGVIIIVLLIIYLLWTYFGG